MRVSREACPQCGSTWFKRNEHIHTGKQNHRCKLCGRAFVRNPEHQGITEEQRMLIERLLLERISLRGICRAVGVGLQWLLQFMVERFQAAPEHLYAEPPGDTPTVIVQRLETELEELWSFAGKKANGSGSGLQWTPPPGKSSRSISVTAVGRVPERCGRRFPPYIRSTLCSIRITIEFIQVSFPSPNTVLSPSWPARLITSNGSTARYGNASRGWCVLRSRSLRNSAITSELSSISFVITTSPKVQHYQYSTTRLQCPARVVLSYRLHDHRVARPPEVNSALPHLMQAGLLVTNVLFLQVLWVQSPVVSTRSKQPFWRAVFPAMTFSLDSRLCEYRCLHEEQGWGMGGTR